MPHAATSNLKFDKPENPAHVINGQGQSRVLLVCEHASNHIPARYAGLGLTKAAKISHAAWDPGAQAISERISALLDAPLVVSKVSRLVYDCNRPPTSTGAIRAVSEQVIVPGNDALTTAEQKERVETVYEPFTQTVTDTIKSFKAAPILVTIHSYTRIYNDHTRDVDVGIIHDADARLSHVMVELSGKALGLRYALNEPYSKADEVAHTLELHATKNGLINVMIEVCNDLLETPEQQDAIAWMLADLLTASLSSMDVDMSQKGSSC
ncbi:MAG: N-formylglutamate amidohydrolase [Amylibacter sp.]